MMVLQQWGLFETNSRLQKIALCFSIFPLVYPLLFPLLHLTKFPFLFPPVVSLSGYLFIFFSSENVLLRGLADSWVHIFIHAFISRFRSSASPFHTYPIFQSWVPAQAFSKLHFHCSMTCKQHSDFCDMQIYFQTPTSSPLLCYTFCIEMFRYIQFDRRGLTSPWEPLSPYFEACPTAFHTWPFLGISFVDRRVGRFMKFPISSPCFLCPPPSNFFPSICNKYTTSLETYKKYLARKWNIYYRFEYIGPSFPSSILNQILVSFSPLLYLSGYLVILLKISKCVGWQTHEFTFALVILYRDSDQSISHSIPSHFYDHKFHGSRALDCTCIVSVTCKQHPDFRDIQIYNQTLTSYPLPCYIVCTQNFRDLQFDY
jgi:hypothetical protein